LFFLFISAGIRAQEGKELKLDKCARMEAGFIFSINSTDTNRYSPGGQMQYSYCIKAHPRAGYGAGLGFNFFRDEIFIPFHIDFIGLLKEGKNGPFVTVQVGYSIGVSSRYINYQDQKFRGGMYFHGGFGNRFAVNDRFSAYVSLSYSHQSANLRYTTGSGHREKEKFNYNMVALSIGLMFEEY
jgi:hypothetical protein